MKKYQKATIEICYFADDVVTTSGPFKNGYDQENEDFGREDIFND